MENGLHWHLDVGFGEDRSRIRKDAGPGNFSTFRKMALLLLLAREESKMSLKRKKANRDEQFLLKILKNS